MALTADEWTDVIFYAGFMANKGTSGFSPALLQPEKLTMARKKELVEEYGGLLGYEGVELEQMLRTELAVKGKSIRAATNACKNWQQVLLSKLTMQNLLRARCFQRCDKSQLEASLVAWRDKAKNLELTVLPNFTDNTATGGVAMWISYKDIQYGVIPTLFALAHEFGHQTDFAIRDQYPDVLKSLYASWSPDDHASWEYYADSFAAVYLGINSADRPRLRDGIEDFLKDEPSDGVHPAGFLRVGQIKAAMTSIDS